MSVERKSSIPTKVSLNEIWNCCTVKYDTVSWGIDLSFANGAPRVLGRQAHGLKHAPIKYLLRTFAEETAGHSERHTVVHAKLYQNGPERELVISPLWGSVPPYFILDVSSELSPERARSFKHGDKRYLVDHGVKCDSASIVSRHRNHTLIQICSGTYFDILYPDGIVSRFHLLKGNIHKQVLTPLEMVEVRLRHVREQLDVGDPQFKIARYNGLLRLMRIQTERACVVAILDFLSQERLAAKTARGIKGVLETLTVRDGFEFREHTFRILKKENNRLHRTDRRKIDARTLHGTFSAFRT